MPEIEWKNLNQSGQDRILEGSYDLLNRKDTLTKVDRQNFIDTATRNRMNDPKFIVKMQQDYYARHHEWYGPALKSTPFDDSGKEYNDENGNHLGPGPSLEDKPKNEPSEDGKPASDKPLGKEKQSATPPDDLPLLVSLGKSVTDWTPSDLARVVASTAFTDPNTPNTMKRGRRCGSLACAGLSTERARAAPFMSVLTIG